MKKVLGKKFFDRDTILVAKELLGKFLVRRLGRRGITLLITEVEVYDGFRDRASHVARGKTNRNSIMFGEAGRWYVYFTYGMHWMLNVVTREVGYPSAVLIRGGILIDRRTLQNFYENKNLGGQVIRQRNGFTRSSFVKQNLGGPAKLTKFLKIDGKLNELPASKKSGLWVEDRGVKIKKIKKGPRVGVNYAGPYWTRRKWRFWISH